MFVFNLGCVDSCDGLFLIYPCIIQSISKSHFLCKNLFPSQTFHPHIHLKRKQHILLFFGFNRFFPFYKRDSDLMIKRTSARKWLNHSFPWIKDNAADRLWHLPYLLIASFLSSPDSLGNSDTSPGRSISQSADEPHLWWNVWGRVGGEVGGVARPGE